MDYEDKGYSRPTARSRGLRRNATEAERKLWRAITARKLDGVGFNRQLPVAPYICDFASREYRLVAAIDGGQHASASDYDERRTRFLNQPGYRVVRFWNSEVLENLDGVLTRLWQMLADMPSSSTSRKREGSVWSPAKPRERDQPC